MRAPEPTGKPLPPLILHVAARLRSRLSITCALLAQLEVPPRLRHKTCEARRIKRSTGARHISPVAPCPRGGFLWRECKDTRSAPTGRYHQGGRGRGEGGRDLLPPATTVMHLAHGRARVDAQRPCRLFCTC